MRRLQREIYCSESKTLRWGDSKNLPLQLVNNEYIGAKGKPPTYGG
jgi:hypothetical protein